MTSMKQAVLRRGGTSLVFSGYAMALFLLVLLFVLLAVATEGAVALPGQARTPQLDVLPPCAPAHKAPVVDPSGPSASVTAPAHSTISSTKTSFTVSWAASPALPSGGFDAYRVEYREPGVDYWLAWEEATTARSAKFTAQAGHAYEFRVAATKQADPSVVGPWSPVRSTAVPVDDASFAVTGAWKRVSASGAYLGRIRVASRKGAAATCRFKGTRLMLIAPRARSYGKVGVYVRSLSGSTWSRYKLVKTVDLYSRKARTRVATSIASYSSSAVERQVKLVVTGTRNRRSTSSRVAFDGLAVYGAPHVTGNYWVNMSPDRPTVVITEQLQFTASIPGCLDQRVEWSAYRVDNLGTWHTDGAGTITDGGLYTAPALPSNTQIDAGDDYRRYIVTAVSRANPEWLFTSRAVEVTLGPAPVVTGVSPTSGDVGSSVVISGSHFTDHGGVPEVFFEGTQAIVGSVSDTSVTATVPGGWQGWSTSRLMYVWVRTWGQQSNGKLFTVTGLKPSPPTSLFLNDDNASVGDTIRVSGHGFSPTVSNNRVRFGGGVIATASDYRADPYWPDVGTLSVVVPEGAQSGPLAFQRTDGDGGWSAEDPVYVNLEVKPATQPTVALHSSFNGFVTGPYMARNGQWAGGPEEWLLQGGNFMKLRITQYSDTQAGVFWLDIRRNGVTCSRIMRAVSDTLAVPHRYWGEQLMFPDEIFASAQPGDTVEIRIRGNELTNRYERVSGWVSVPLGPRPVYGAVLSLPVDGMVEWWGTGYKIARGDWLRLYCDGGPATQEVSCPGVWTGRIPLGADGIDVKLVHLTTDGTYTVTNHTTGESTTFTVGDMGKEDGKTYRRDDLLTDGLLMRSSGSEIDVPPGAFSPDDLGSSTTFQVSIYREPGASATWDPTITDGGHRFTLEVLPHVTKLLKPIRVTVPYEVGERTTVPFLGMWDQSAGLYFDFRVPSTAIDTVKHRITYIIPAGDYPHPSAPPAGSSRSSAKSSAPPAVRGAAPPNIPFNQAFSKVGAVSAKVATSGEDYVWHSPTDPSWGIRVDAVTDPDSSSYVPPAKAQKVLDTAVATWTNLVGKGWTEPDAMITITVRDYGDPGVYQGSTTKGVFGQPWVYVNSRLTAGPKLDTAVSHEMGHVFQRQLTTNITTKWIDEAVAEWIAWDTLGSGSDLRASFEAGCDFPTVAFPGGFWSGYTPEQAYGAGAFIIWLADTYGAAAVLDIYETLAYNPEYWYDAPATFQEATRQTVPQLVAGFASEFWLQTYDPIKPYTWSSRARELLPAFTGKTLALSLPTDSSRGLVFAPTAQFSATLSGKPMVARAPGLPVGAFIDVYRDSTTASAPPSAPVKIGTLSSLEPVLDLGTYGGGCYRMVAVTPPGASLTANVTVEAVHLASISPTSVRKGGGTIVTLSGCGFGDQKGIVMVGPASASGESITSWTDTQIRFVMPNMGTQTGVHPVDVRPVIGGMSNSVDLTVTN